MHDRIIGALETCCWQGEILRIQNRHVEWPQHQIVIPGANAKDAENRRIPFDPQGRLAPILMRRAQLGLDAFVFGAPGSRLKPGGWLRLNHRGIRAPHASFRLKAEARSSADCPSFVSRR
jgi:hypothetical protein